MKAKQNNWSSQMMKLENFKYFTQLKVPKICREFYLKHELKFIRLIHQSYDTYESIKDRDPLKNGLLYKEVFGAHPNKKNVTNLFQCPVVKCLWQSSFYNCTEYKAFLSDFNSYNVDQQHKFIKYLNSLNSTFPILKEYQLF